MRVALDANRYVDLVAGDAALTELLEECESIHVPIIVLGELRAGFAAGRRSLDNERLLIRFLRRDGVVPLAPDEQTTHHYASIYRQLRAQGTPIPTNDMWIAALVLQHDLTLFSRDAHFDRLPQIRRA